MIFLDPEKIPGIPLDIGKDGKAKRGRGGLKTALQLVQHSTASMGRYARNSFAIFFYRIYRL